MCHRDIGEADVLFKKRSRTAGRYLSNSFAVDENILVIAGDATLSHFKTNQLAFDAFLLLLREGFATNKVAFIEFANPTEIRFEQGGGFVDVVAVERHARFESQRVASGEAAGKYACW